MTLSDNAAYRHVIGGLMSHPQLLLEYTDIKPYDFDYRPARICLNAIKKMYEEGAVELSILEIDQEIARAGGAALQIYQAEGGLDFLKDACQIANVGNFEIYYTRLKKYSLLRKLKQANYDISEFYIDDKDVTNPILEQQIKAKLEQASIDDILNSIEKNYSEIRNEFLNGGRLNGDPAEGIYELIEDLKNAPSIGPGLEGKIFSSVCRGARKGCFFLKSASTSAGKTRTSIFDACHLAYPKRWSHKANSFIEEIDALTGKIREPRKVLFIVTEMDKEEIQTIMLAYLSGVDEDLILTGRCELDLLKRVKTAAKIIEEYSGYFIIEEISEPNLQNVEATIRKYATIDDIKYVFFDYIHSTASMISQFTRNNIREDVILMMMANQLKQLAKDYKLFIFSATQVNALAMGDEEMSFKDEKSIRGAKSIADKADVGYVMTRITDKAWNSIVPTLTAAIKENIIPASIMNNKPTHILDIYKMRRGRYKMVRIWTKLHLGTGEREDIFITTAENQPIKMPLDLFENIKEQPIQT